MRVLLNIELDTAKGNEIIASGRMGEVMEGIIGKLRPEASYFYARNGSRAITLVVDSPDGAALPSLLEPFWLQLGARVEAVCYRRDCTRMTVARSAAFTGDGFSFGT